MDQREQGKNQNRQNAEAPGAMEPDAGRRVEMQDGSNGGAPAAETGLGRTGDKERREPLRLGGRISRRRLLASLGLTGAAVVSGGLLHAMGKGNAEEGDGKKPITDASRVAYAYGENQPERTVAAKLRESVSVKDFGAEGDGTTDDTTAIQAALDAGAGRTVVVPAGRYRISDTLIVPAGTVLIGDNTSDAWDSQSTGTIIMTSGAGMPRKWTDISEDDQELITPAIVFGGNEVFMENMTVECGSVRWDAGIFLPCVKRSSLYNVDTAGQWKKAGLYLDATWSTRNQLLRGLHPQIATSSGMNEFHAENCYFRGLWGVLVQGTTRDPDQYDANNWLWGWGGTSDLSFVNCRMGSVGPTAERQADGGCFKHDAAIKNAARAGQGHNFVNCAFRTSSKYMILLDRSNRDTFINCYGETISSWTHGAAAFAITSRTGEIGRLNDKINAPVMLDGNILFSGAGSTPYRPETKMSVHRTTGQWYTPNFSGFGESASNPTEVISYFMSPGNDGRTVFKHGTSIFADIDRGRLNLRDIPLVRANSGFNFDIGTNRKLSLNASANISHQVLRPGADAEHNLGTSGYRWNNVFAASGSISTSDERTKQQITDIPDEWLDAWAEVKYCRFKFNDAVRMKGDGARWHVGLIAQDIHKAFAKRGIDAFEIGLLCYDEWEGESSITHETDEAGHTVEREQVLPAGSVWGVRADECQFMEMALMRRELDRLKRS